MIFCLPLADGAAKQLSLPVTHQLFSKEFPLWFFFSQLIPSILASPCYYQRSRATSSTEGFFQAIYILVREIIGYDVSITVAVFDYVHWKLHIASFLLKSLFSFFQRRGFVRPRKILITISTYTIWHYVPSNDNFTSTTLFLDAYTFNKELIIRAFILQSYVEWFLSLE